MLFLLYGDVCSLSETIDTAHQRGKQVFVHMDLINGLSQQEAAVDFVAMSTAADGIISTKPLLVRRAHELGLVSIQRVFLLDSLALQNVEQRLSSNVCDLIEILPGLMPRIIDRICRATRKPVIAGGLISEKEDVIAALKAGAIAISSTAMSVWQM